MGKKIYRKDIQGMRAIAVLLVVLFHLGVPFVPSGLMGVDIFFVISGFLITSIAYSEIESGNFSLRVFYLKRMRRILPALLLVLFFTSVAAIFILLPPELISFSSSLLASLLSIANIYFWKIVPIGYFQVDTRIIPLVHIWSLGVEEQFYIFWPLFLLLGTKFLSKGKFFILCCFVFLVSVFLTSVWLWLPGHTRVVFYSPISRAFELLSGCMLALYGSYIPQLPNKILNQLCSLFGLAMIIFVSSITKPNTPLSVLWELIVCLGTLLLIYTGMNHQTIVSKVLSFSVLTFIGSISYSLYLVHWPILSYVRYLDIQITCPIKLLILSLSVFLAFILYKFIETPFRKTITFSFSKTFIYFLVLPIVLASIFFIFARVTHGYENRFTKKVNEMIKSSHISGYSVLGNCFGGNPGQPETEKKCLIGAINKEKYAEVLLVGDSHAGADINMVNILLKHENLKGYVVTRQSTPYLTNAASFSYEESDKKNRIARDNAITKIIKEHDFQYVVMAGLWASYSDQGMGVNQSKDSSYSLLKKGLVNALKVIISRSAIPVIILDTPPPLYMKPNCPIISNAFDRNLDCKIDRGLVNKFQGKSREMIIGLKKQFPTLVFIDPSKVLCNKINCFSVINSNPVYFDNIFPVGVHSNGHLTAAASSEVARLYLKKYSDPF